MLFFSLWVGDWFALEFFKDIVWWNEAIVTGEGFKIERATRMNKNQRVSVLTMQKQMRMRRQ